MNKSKADDTHIQENMMMEPHYFIYEHMLIKSQGFKLLIQELENTNVNSF